MRTLKTLTLLCIAVSLAFLLGGCTEGVFDRPGDAEARQAARRWAHSIDTAPLSFWTDPELQAGRDMLRNSRIEADAAWYEVHSHGY